MDYYQIIAKNFQDTIENIAMSVDDLAEPVERGSQLLANALLSDRKIILCGNGVDAAVAGLFACNLLDRFEADRPALPALTLAADNATVSAIAQSNGINDIYSRQIRAIGQSGDILLCINSSQGAGNLLRAIQAAHERNMCVIVMSNTGDGELGTLIRDEDVELQVQATRRARVVELHTMIIHCFCELIDQRLFGNYAQE